MPVVITSADNPQYKALRKLAQSGRERRKSGLTLLDGLHLIKAWQASGGNLQEIFANATLAENAELQAWQSVFPRIPLTLLAAGRYAEIAGDDFPAGILGLVETPAGPGTPDANCDTVVFDGVQDPGNLGTMLRTSAAAGFTQAVLSSTCAQVWGPKTLRAGMGAHFAMRIHEAADLPAFLQDFAGTVAVTELRGATSLFAADLAAPVAWVFGSEGEGVSAGVSACATLRIKIPMPGQVESLNVSAAAAVCLFETLRQRKSSSR